MATDGAKRRKTADRLHIDDLPDIALAHAAEFLCKPSRALFAAALTASTEKWVRSNWKLPLSTRSKSIISSDQSMWDTLDLEDVEDINEDLASKVHDGHLGALLSCVQSVGPIKRLNLGRCVNVKGHGLEPLRGCDSLQMIDLSLVGRHDSRNIDLNPSISEQDTLPILESIMDAEGSCLSYVRIPAQWSENGSEQLRGFLHRYAQHLDRMFSCSECDEAIGWFAMGEGPYFGMQLHTCSECLRFHHDNCPRDNGDDRMRTESCFNCEREFCVTCSEVTECKNCAEGFCKGCFVTQCEQCSGGLCDDCSRECGVCGEIRCKPCGMRICEAYGCNIVHCLDCLGHEDENFDVGVCELCDSEVCSACRHEACSFNWSRACPACVKLVARTRTSTLEARVSSLEAKVEELDKEVYELRLENMRLKKNG